MSLMRKDKKDKTQKIDLDISEEYKFLLNNIYEDLKKINAFLIKTV